MLLAGSMIERLNFCDRQAERTASGYLLEISSRRDRLGIPKFAEFLEAILP
jgi:hypothetical protein